MVGREPCRLLHRSARTGRHEGNAAFLPRAFAPTAARLELVRSWHVSDVARHPTQVRNTPQSGRPPALQVDSSRLGQTFCSRDDEARLCARNHTPNAITTAAASVNHVMAYCR